MIALLIEWGATAWRFLKSPLGIRVAIALGVVVAIGFAGHVVYEAGRKHERAEYAKLAAKAEKHVAETKKKSDAITEKVNGNLASENAKIDTLTNQLHKETQAYVSPQADRRCTIPVGYVRLRDAAGTGSAPVPIGPGRSEDADSGLALSAIAEADIENGRSFNQLSNEVKAWRAWYVGQADLWELEYGAKR